MKILSLIKKGKRCDVDVEAFKRMRKQEYTKDDVNFRPSNSHAYSCEGCANFFGELDPPECDIVEGVVNPTWVCDEFEKKYGD